VNLLKDMDAAAIIARLDNEMDGTAAAQFDARMAADAALRAEYHAVATVHAALDSIRLVPETDPINIEDAVLSGLRDIRSGRRVYADDDLPADLALMAHCEGGTSELAQSIMRRRFDHTPELQNEAAAYRAIAQVLESIPHKHRDRLPALDLGGAILDRIALESPEFEQLLASFESIGELLRSKAGNIDVVDNVMESVARARRQPNIVPFRARPAQRSGRMVEPRTGLGRFRAAMYAAAAVLLFSVGFLSRDLANTPTPARQAAMDQDAASRRLRELRARLDEDRLTSPLGRLRHAENTPSNHGAPAVEPASNPPQQNNTPENTPSTMDILNAQRAALMNDARALASLAEWASLSPDAAMAAIEKLGFSSDAILGAIPFLDPDAARGLLQAAVGRDPQNPELRAALAQNLAEAGRYDESRQQLAAWSQLDPNNSLPVFMDSQLLFAKGDTQGALARLYDTTNYSGLNTYTLGTARQHETILRASGMPQNSAATLSAIAASNGDYNYLLDLGRGLIYQGKNFASNGDYTNAFDTYHAALELGRQLEDQAPFMNEAVAAVLLQQEALDALELVRQAAQLSPDAIEYLGQATYDLINSVSQLSQIYVAANELFTRGDISLIQNYLNAVLNGNELGFLQSPRR
jgi:hypothetical protein